MAMSPAEKAELVLRLAREVGFERAGIAAAGPLPRADYVARWLQEGRAGEMHYLQRWHELRMDVRRLVPGARSVVVVAHNYHFDRRAPQEASGGAEQKTERGRDREAESSSRNPRPDPRNPKPETRDPNPDARHPTARGRVAQYALGRDYHHVMRKKLHKLVAAVRAALHEDFAVRVCVDTAPVLERELAAAAGIGWIGKNTMVLHQVLGSFFFLGEIITTLELAASAPAAEHCGTCTRCLEACPTGALTAPYQMDATRCISYLTIEHRSDIPTQLEPAMGDWVYGCDVCQDVCPFNRRAPQTGEPAYRAAPEGPAEQVARLDDVLTWTQPDYDRNLQGSAIKRASLDMLQRNARIAAANANQENTGANDQQ